MVFAYTCERTLVSWPRLGLVTQKLKLGCKKLPPPPFPPRSLQGTLRICSLWVSRLKTTKVSKNWEPGAVSNFLGRCIIVWCIKDHKLEINDPELTIFDPACLSWSLRKKQCWRYNFKNYSTFVGKQSAKRYMVSLPVSLSGLCGTPYLRCLGKISREWYVIWPKVIL